MKTLIEGLNKNFDNRVRLGIMSSLMVNECVEFNTLKDLLGVTDGNLASHLKGLEKAGIICVHKQFVGRKPNTSYTISDFGKIQFNAHIDALEKLLKGA